MQSENLIAGHNKQEITVIKSQVASKASITRGQRCRNKLLPCLRPKKHNTQYRRSLVLANFTTAIFHNIPEIFVLFIFWATLATFMTNFGTQIT